MDFQKSLEIFYSYTVFNIKIYRVIVASLILIGFLLLRKLFVKLFFRLLNHLEMKPDMQDGSQLIKNMETPIRLLIVLLGLYFSVLILKLPVHTHTFSVNTIGSLSVICIFGAAYISSRPITSFLFKYIGKVENGLGNSLLLFFNNVVKAIIIILGTSIILQIWGYSFAALLTGLGLGGLAFALAAKDTVANLFGSIMIMLDRPFTIGDWIITSKAEGKVEVIGFRSTRIRTYDHSLVTVPNSVMSNEFVTNMSRNDKRRINIRLSISSSTCSSTVRELIARIRTVLEYHEGVGSEDIMVYFERFNGSKLDIYIDFLIRTSKWQESLEIQNDINFQIKDVLDELNINAQ